MAQKVASNRELTVDKNDYIGIRVANDSIETERLNPKFNQASSGIILVQFFDANYKQFVF